ncbi:MAG: hypothetical protein AB7U23_11445 [Dehalococcoidia bacterium]
MSNTLMRGAATAVLIVALAVAQTSVVSAQAPGEIGGNLPQNGGYAIVVWGGGTPDALVQAATDKGCSPASIWITAQGQFVPYVVGAPDFVNEGFIERFDGGSLPGGTPVIIVCQTL